MGVGVARHLGRDAVGPKGTVVSGDCGCAWGDGSPMGSCSKARLESEAEKRGKGEKVGDEAEGEVEGDERGRMAAVSFEWPAMDSAGRQEKARQRDRVQHEATTDN